MNNIKKHVGSLKYIGGGGGEVYRKIITFYLADFLDKALKNIQRMSFHIFQQ